ncbi:MAG: DUF2089 domain-containing protein [Chloroflexota bacterium]
MRNLIKECPACGGELIVTQQNCTDCETVILGRFKPNIFSRLSPENLQFLELFVKNRGNVKDMEREMGSSYWTIRNRLNEIIIELGFEADASEEPALTEQEERVSAAAERQNILAQLENGELTAAEAAAKLARLKQ